MVRRARTSDVPAIKRLVDVYAGKILLEKNLVTLYEAVQEFWVAELDGELVGCGALHVLWADLEIPSLAAAIELEDRNQLMLGFTENLPEAIRAFADGRPPAYTDEPRRDMFSG